MRPAKLLNESYWTEYCHDIFGIDLQIKRSVAEFAGHHTAGSNVFISNGGEDPWQWATELKPNHRINQFGSIADCDDCGHCGDLYTPKKGDKPELIKQRMEIIHFVNMVLLQHREAQEQFLQ